MSSPSDCSRSGPRAGSDVILCVLLSQPSFTSGSVTSGSCSSTSDSATTNTWNTGEAPRRHTQAPPSWVAFLFHVFIFLSSTLWHILFLAFKVLYEYGLI